jgi:hypothetical protein
MQLFRQQHPGMQLLQQQPPQQALGMQAMPQVMPQVTPQGTPLLQLPAFQGVQQPAPSNQYANLFSEMFD